MKSIVLLTTALFLASAPTPDSDVISELSAGFLLPANAQALMAAEAVQTTQRVQGGVSTSTPLAADKPVKVSLRKTVKNLLPAE